MARKALLIACDTFEDSNFPSLKYSLRDAERLSRILTDREFGFFDNAYNVNVNPKAPNRRNNGE